MEIIVTEQTTEEIVLRFSEPGKFLEPGKIACEVAFTRADIKRTKELFDLLGK